MSDSFYSIRQSAQGEIKRKGSRFIGEAKSSATVEEAEQALLVVRKREHAATHHCYAYHVGLDTDEHFKYSDDGEPTGTAGRPIYDVLRGRELTNTLVVVTRYYGGTKLGTGGLVRAYGDAAIEALDQAGIRTNLITTDLSVDIEFALYDQLMKMIARLGATVSESDFADKVHLTLTIARSKKNLLRDEIIGLSSGRAVFGDDDA